MYYNRNLFYALKLKKMSNSLSQSNETPVQKRTRMLGEYINLITLTRNNLPANQYAHIISCGVNIRNPKNKISLFHGELQTVIRDTIALINQRFYLTLSGKNENGEVIIKNQTRHFSCKFFIPLQHPDEFCLSTSMNMYSYFTSNLIYSDRNHPRYEISLISSARSSETYLVITDIKESMFFYGVLVLADRTVRTHEQEVQHATNEITKYFPINDD